MTRQELESQEWFLNWLIATIDKPYSNYNMDNLITETDDSIVNHFVWEDTKEGDDYWYDIYMKDETCMLIGDIIQLVDYYISDEYKQLHPELFI